MSSLHFSFLLRRKILKCLQLQIKENSDLFEICRVVFVVLYGQSLYVLWGNLPSSSEERDTQERYSHPAGTYGVSAHCVKAALGHGSPALLQASYMVSLCSSLSVSFNSSRHFHLYGSNASLAQVCATSSLGASTREPERPGQGHNWETCRHKGSQPKPEFP